MFRFASPEYFQFLLFVPFLVLLAWFGWRRANAALTKFVGSHLKDYLGSSISLPKRKIKLLMQVIALSLFAIALARPQYGQSEQEIRSEGIEMILAVDVSNSMLAEDIKPSRLDLAKKSLHQLLDQMAGHKIGLLIFAGSAILSSPLTSDYSALRMYIDSLSTNSISTQGTIFARPIEEAWSAFEKGGTELDELTRVTRVLLITSDGEDNEEGAMKLAEEYLEKGMRIFTLGIGTEEGAPIPIRDDFGYLKGYKKSQSGEVINTVAKTQILKDLAAAGGGSYYHAFPGGDHIEKVVADINKLEKTEFDNEMLVNYDEKFQIFLLFAILFALIEFFLGERKAKGKIWRGRFEVRES